MGLWSQKIASTYIKSSSLWLKHTHINRILFFHLRLFFFAVNACTLPHPRHNNGSAAIHMTRDDQMLISKGVYIPSPSPAPPPDGSYYNMNSDRYLSYPPMVSEINEPASALHSVEALRYLGFGWDPSLTNGRCRLNCPHLQLPSLIRCHLAPPTFLVPRPAYCAQLTKVLRRTLGTLHPAMRGVHKSKYRST